METIVNIESNRDFIDPTGIDDRHRFQGFIITTNTQKIFFGVSNSQDCCESFGEMLSHDNPKEFIGAKLLSINVVDKSLNVTRFEEKCGSLNEGGAVFINVETDKGTFQMTVYNAHNGHYSHAAIIRSQKLNQDWSL